MPTTRGMGLPSGHPRFPHPLLSRTRRALALGALLLGGLWGGMSQASAQLVPDGCLQNPASCVSEPPSVPSLPPVDGCVSDPASCLPAAPEATDVPEVDPCLKDPASCLPEVPVVDPCLEDPASCLPDTEDVDKCVESPRSCLPVKTSEKQEPGQTGEEPGGRDDDEEGSVIPGKRGGQRPGSGGRGSTGGREGPASAPDPAPVPTGSPLADAPLSGEPEGVLDRIARGLADGARRFAFPMAIAGLAGIFLLLQGRLDRRDPKLAAAPIDSRDDLVIFR